jgi:hypothetical protein
MRLTELEPTFVWKASETEHSWWEDAPSLAEAQGILFKCPVCGRRDPTRSSHSILVWFADRAVPTHHEPTPRWAVAGGSSFEDLTLSPSIDLTRDRTGQEVIRPWEWHGHIQNGEVT